MYSQLYAAFIKKYSNVWSKQKIQEETNLSWKAYKEDKKNFPGNVQKKIDELKEHSTAQKARSLAYFVKVVLISLYLF